MVSIALGAGVLASCAPQTPPTGPTPQQQFCEFFDKVKEAPPTQTDAVLVKDDVVALASDTTVTGAACDASNAKVALDGATLAEGEEVAAEQGSESTEKVAAITGDELGTGEAVLDNLTVQALSAEIGVGGITLRGNVSVRLSGVTSTIGFVGTLQSLDNWSISLSSAGLTLPGIVSSPVVFNGTLKMTNGVPSLQMTALATQAKIGDITVNSATIQVNASTVTGVSAMVSGSLKIGPSSASGTVNVAFDPAGALVTARADISAHLVGNAAGGKKIDLTGTVKLEGNANETAVSFTGSGIVGDLVVNEANGSLTLATNKATLVAKLDVQQGPNVVRFNGTIVWDGTTAYTPFLQLEGAGEYSGTLQDGQEVSVKGNVTTEIIGGQIRAVVSGDFKVGTLKAQGSAIVESNGATTTLYLDAALQGAGFGTDISGVVQITDGIAETVQIDGTVNGAVNLGDVTLTGATFSIRSSYGSPLDLSFTGGLKVGTRADLTGAVKASFGPNGGLLALEGSMNGSLLLDSWGILGFQGSVVASSQQVSLTGSGNVQLTSLPLGVAFRGTFTSSLTSPTWSLSGTGKLKLFSFEVAQARLTLSQTAGMKATRVGFYFSIIGIQTYFEGDFYLKASGGCDKVNITAGSFLAKPILALVLPGVIGCPVYI